MSGAVRCVHVPRQPHGRDRCKRLSRTPNPPGTAEGSRLCTRRIGRTTNPTTLHKRKPIRPNQTTVSVISLLVSCTACQVYLVFYNQPSPACRPTFDFKKVSYDEIDFYPQNSCLQPWCDVILGSRVLQLPGVRFHSCMPAGQHVPFFPLFCFVFPFARARKAPRQWKVKEARGYYHLLCI